MARACGRVAVAAAAVVVVVSVFLSCLMLRGSRNIASQRAVEAEYLSGLRPSRMASILLPEVSNYSGLRFARGLQAPRPQRPTTLAVTMWSK